MEFRTRSSARRLRQALLPAMALLAALSLTVTAGMYGNADTLDKLFGRGARTVTAVGGTQHLDTAYYGQRYGSKQESLAAATALSRQISGEGIVLLKNDGLLPLGEGTAVSPYYDSLLGKLIVFAGTREEALRKLRASLCELVIDGIPTNLEEQLRIVEDERFTSGNYDLTFMGNG